MIRLAVIGRNFVVDSMIEAMKHVPELELCGICSRSAEGAREFGERYGIDPVHRYVGIHALAHAEDIDAVYIATPNTVHAAQAVAMLESGKHVLVEKPAAVSAKELGHMTAAAKRNGKILMEAMMPLYTPAFAVAKRLIRNIAPVRCATLSYRQYSSRYDALKQGKVENAFNPELGGGALTDLGVYCAAVAEGLFGTPHRIGAEAMFLETGVDGLGSASLMYNGMMADLTYSKICDGARGAEICGEEGIITLDSVSRPRYVTLRLRSGGVRRYDGDRLDLERFDIKRLDDAALASIELDADGHTPSDAVQPLPTMTHELRHFVHLVERGSVQLAGFDLAHTEGVAAILDGIAHCCDIKHGAKK